MEKELKQKIKDQEIYIVGLQYKIEQLQHKLDNLESYQREKCCECEREAIVKYADECFKLTTLKDRLRKFAEEV